MKKRLMAAAVLAAGWLGAGAAWGEGTGALPPAVGVKASDTGSAEEASVQVDVPTGGMAFFSLPFYQKAVKFKDIPLATALPQGFTVLFWDDEAQLWSGGMKSAKGWPDVVNEHVLAPGEGLGMRGPNGAGLSMSVTGVRPQAGTLSRDFPGGDAWSIMAYPYPAEIKFGDTELALAVPQGSQVRFRDSAAQAWGAPLTKTWKGWPSEAAGHVLGVGEAFFLQSKAEGTWEAENPGSGGAQTAAVRDGATAGRRLDGERAATDGGMCVLWGSGGWMMASGGESPVAKDNEVIWQLIDAGADGKASAPVLKRENWLGGDDVLLAVREIPKGGGVAGDGTTWDDQLLQTGGVAVYVDAARRTGGKVYQRLYQGQPKEGGAYFQTGLFEFGATHAWAGDPPELFYFDGAGNGVAMDREVSEEQGSEANPIQIATRGDWEALAAFVAGGGDTEGVFYKQTADIAGVTNGVGTMELPFRGTYDGDGKTLAVSLSGGDVLAPFTGIEGAAIRNLTVEGNVAGGMHCAGLVGYAEGTNRIESCVVWASVVTTNTHCGGFVGHGRNSQTTLSGCVFRGDVSGTTAVATNLATIWGWSEGATVTLESCLDASDSVFPIGLGSADPGTNGVRNTYYLSEDKTTSDWRKWSYRGKLGFPVAAADGVQMSLSAGSAGVAFSGMVFAGAGETVRLSLEDGTGEDDYRATAGTLAKDGEAWRLTMPDTHVLVYPARGIPYVDPTDGNQVKYCTDFDSMSEGTWKGGKWYVAEMDFFMVGRVQVEGAANLILRDGVLVTVNEGIRVGKGASLTIWGQQGGSGRLEATGAGDCAGIGGNKEESCGAVTINGGVVVAQGGKYGAGIGGGDTGNGGKVTVNGGTVAATGNEGSAGIGGGDYGNGGEFKITGGKVTATGSTRHHDAKKSGQASPGIGAGRPKLEDDGSVGAANHRTSGTVAILGGELAAFAGVPDPDRLHPDPAQAMGVNSKDANYNEANNANWLALGEVAAYTSANAAEPVSAGDRGAACRGTNVWVRTCPHRRGEDLTCVWCGAGLPPDLPGKGTEEEPYLIGNYKDLKEFALVVNGGNTGPWGRLTNDIVATGTDWTPMNTFNGSFDGCGHTISGLSNEGVADPPAYVGLFGMLMWGAVRNVRLESVSIKGPVVAGGIAARMEAGAVSNCCVSGNVSGMYVGGIIAYNQGMVANCWASGRVTGSACAGGIVGVNQGKSSVTNCYGVCEVEGDSHGGGVVGSLQGAATVANSYCLAGTGVVGSDGGLTVSECRELSAEEFRDAGNFKGWNFRNVWVMGPERPLLRVFEVPSSETVGETTWYYWTDWDGGTNATVAGVSPAVGNLTIPATLGGLPVAEIAAGAFEGCGELTGLWIPDGVGSVGAGAFEGSGLAELSVPGAWKESGVLEGAGVPEGCQVTYRGDKLRILAIGVGSNSVALQFDQNAATVFGTDDLKGEWKVIPRPDFTLEGTNATIPLEKAFRFLRAE